MKYEDLLRYEIASSWLVWLAPIPGINTLVSASIARRTERKRVKWLELDGALNNEQLKTQDEIYRRFGEFSLVWLNDTEMHHAVSKALHFQRLNPLTDIPYSDIAKEVKQQNS